MKLSWLRPVIGTVEQPVHKQTIAPAAKPMAIRRKS
jgi:hypothetical protein